MSFTPRFILPQEYSQFGLPNSTQVPKIDYYVQLASGFIDDACGRTDGDGVGSLVYTTYTERILNQSGNRQIYMLPHRPLAVVTQETIAALQTMDAAASGNFYDSGCLPATTFLPDGSQSAILSASGRHSYGRRGRGNHDIFGIAAYFDPASDLVIAGNPIQWYPIDVANAVYDPRTGQLELNENRLYGDVYSEIIVTYNSGFDPRNLPRQLKYACAQVTLNIVAKMGVTGLLTFSAGRAAAQAEYLPEIIDPNVSDMLTSFKTVRVN